MPPFVLLNLGLRLWADADDAGALAFILFLFLDVSAAPLRQASRRLFKGVSATTSNGISTRSATNAPIPNGTNACESEREQHAERQD